jgi:hypothetical protein
VKGLKLKNVTFHLKHNDLRPAIVIEDGKSIELDNCKLPAANGAESVIRLENVDGALIRKTETGGNASAFVLVEGRESNSIRLDNNKTGDIKKKIQLGPGVKSIAVDPK